MLSILESVNVWAYFKKGTIQPYIFFWNNRQIKIDKVNLVHTTKDGANPNYHFSVSSGGNFYQLGFDPIKLSWFLEAVEESD